MAKRPRIKFPQTVLCARPGGECTECGRALRWKKSTNARPHEFPDFGFRVAAGGASTATCTGCRTAHACVGSPEGFRRSIVEQVLRKPGALAPMEIRFVRKQLGLTGGQFATLIGVSREHVSHIERGHAPNLGTAPDRLARMIVASRIDPSLRLLKGLLSTLDDEIGTRARRKALRHSGYRVSVPARRS